MVLDCFKFFFEDTSIKTMYKKDLNLSPYTIFHGEFVSAVQIGPNTAQNLIFTIFFLIRISTYKMMMKN